MKICDLQNQFKRYALYERGMEIQTYQTICASLKMLCNFAQTEELHRLDKEILQPD